MIERKDVDGIRTLKLAHGKVSAMDIELGEALVKEMEDARDPVGTGPSSSPGQDRRSRPASISFACSRTAREYGRRFLPVLDNFLRAALTLPKPMIAAINGHAIAGGCILAATCDHRIMTEGTARIGIPELVVGVPFPALPLQIMSARVADGPLRDLVFTGRTVLIDEAKTLGLIDEKCPSGMLMDRAMEAAAAVGGDSCRRVRTDEAGVLHADPRTHQQLADMNARVVDAWLQQHTYDTIRAYLEKTVGKK